MNYNRKIMRLELSAEKALNGGYYYAELLLPAADYEIKDAMQRTRAVGRENTVEVSILECDILPELQDIRLDTFSLDELNFLAKRLASLPDEELPVFYAVTEQIFNDADENPVSIKDLINCTYGLDTVPVAHNVSNLSELGRFAFENELLSDLEGIPESAVPFLNAEQIGRVQQKNDNGVFEGNLYIPTVHYDRPEIYDGKNLPEEEAENSVFLLKVGSYPKHSFSAGTPALYDLRLPADSDKLFNITRACGEPEINLCFCYEFYSSVPQITSDMFESMEEIDELNSLAQRITRMSEAEQVKFKAILDAENTASIQDALNAAHAAGFDVVACGDGPLEEKFCAAMRAGDRYLGRISGTDAMKAFYADCDVLLVPSSAETFGMVYLEAMSQGVPVLYTKGQGFDGQFPEGEVGYAVPCGDVRAQAQALGRVMQGYAERSKRCIEGARRYAWPRIAGMWMELYREI